MSIGYMCFVRMLNSNILKFNFTLKITSYLNTSTSNCFILQRNENQNRFVFSFIVFIILKYVHYMINLNTNKLYTDKILTIIKEWFSFPVHQHMQY